MLLLLSLAAMAEVKMELLSASAAVSSPAKELTEDVIMAEVLEVLLVGVLASCVLLHTLLSMLVIYPSLLWVTEDLIGISDFLEFLLCSLRIVLVFIRMELDSHLFERFLDLVLSGSPLQTKELIVVLSQGTHEEQGSDEYELFDMPKSTSRELGFHF